MDDRIVTVCSECFRASCWHGEDFCREYRTAGTVEMTSKDLDELGLEPKDNYSAAKIAKVCGEGP